MDATEPLLRELIGAALRSERHRRGLTLAQVATSSGVSMQHLSDVERGRKDPSSELLSAITGALGMSVVDLCRQVSHAAVGPRRGVLLELRSAHPGPTPTPPHPTAPPVTGGRTVGLCAA